MLIVDISRYIVGYNPTYLRVTGAAMLTSRNANVKAAIAGGSLIME